MKLSLVLPLVVTFSLGAGLVLLPSGKSVDVRLRERGIGIGSPVASIARNLESSVYFTPSMKSLRKINLDSFPSEALGESILVSNYPKVGAVSKFAMTNQNVTLEEIYDYPDASALGDETGMVLTLEQFRHSFKTFDCRQMPQLGYGEDIEPDQLQDRGSKLSGTLKAIYYFGHKRDTIDIVELQVVKGLIVGLKCVTQKSL